MSDKKKVPNLIKIDIPHNQWLFESLHVNAVYEDFKKGYLVSDYDKELFCAILIKNMSVVSFT